MTTIGRVAASLPLLASLVVGCGITVSSTPPPRAAPPMDEGRAVAEAYVRAYDAGDPQGMLAFRKAHWSHRVPWIGDDRFVAQYNVAHALIPSIAPRPMALAADGIGFIAQTTDGDWLETLLDFEAASPHGVTAARKRCVYAPLDETPPPPSNDGELVARSRAFVDAIAARGAFSGVVLIAKDGAPLWTAAYGMANRAQSVPNQIDTQIEMGSTGKMFTAIAVAQLVSQGKMDYADPIGKWIPDYPLPSAQVLTVAELLSHTSGLGDFLETPGFKARGRALQTPEEWIREFGAVPSFPRGAFHYSNFGYVVLGRIVERASGMAFDDYLQSKVLAPAGMQSTGARPRPDAKSAIPYTWQGEAIPQLEPADATRYQLAKGIPAGLGFSTAGDMLRFANALTGDKLVGADARALLTTTKTVMDVAHPEDTYGYGFVATTTNGTRHFGHGGSWLGVNSFFEIVPDGGYVVIALANFDQPAASRVGQRIVGFIANAAALKKARN